MIILIVNRQRNIERIKVMLTVRLNIGVTPVEVKEIVYQETVPQTGIAALYSNGTC